MYSDSKIGDGLDATCSAQRIGEFCRHARAAHLTCSQPCPTHGRTNTVGSLSQDEQHECGVWISFPPRSGAIRARTRSAKGDDAAENPKVRLGSGRLLVSHAGVCVSLVRLGSGRLLVSHAVCASLEV